jgi:streptogramin lyase
MVLSRGVQTIAVGKEPSGIAIGGGFVRVASAIDGTVMRMDLRSNVSVQTMHVGSEPSDIAYGEAAVWVADSGDSTVTRIDPRTGTSRSLPVPADLCVSRALMLV